MKKRGKSRGLGSERPPQTIEMIAFREIIHRSFPHEKLVVPVCALQTLYFTIHIPINTVENHFLSPETNLTKSDLTALWTGTHHLRGIIPHYTPDPKLPGCLSEALPSFTRARAQIRANRWPPRDAPSADVLPSAAASSNTPSTSRVVLPWPSSPPSPPSPSW